ncbi:LOW QUALITY PROTEIN: hypothetical protein KUTeg_024610 [Tegillarca granosa]|uniref:Uncharacterized protein n=1 Tax=Tegillarca granosa TaxID=220873 RepID=A0ABQ9E1T9_TEGGR|nr:LOW QUALITY PROTEIN: hypothetical protein KUTeg_024610 [Tegillarca granosa]
MPSCSEQYEKEKVIVTLKKREPINIETDILVRSMGPSYSMQCYLRQRWFDERLKFSLENISEVTLSNSFLKNIWKPNTYFLNGRGSKQHNMTVPNVFVRIREDGLIYMSRRITIKALCPMMLMDYPMDRPVCPLMIDGYTTQDVVYLWKYGNTNSVDVYNDVTMSQFNMATIKARNFTEINHFGEFSVLEVYFYLQRHLGFFFLQTYLPCSLIVCLSWVSFWINRDAAPAASQRSYLQRRDGLPRVPYATALDIYLNVCIVYNLAAMIEYAAVNYFTKVVSKDVVQDKSKEGKICGEEEEEEVPKKFPRCNTKGGEEISGDASLFHFVLISASFYHVPISFEEQLLLLCIIFLKIFVMFYIIMLLEPHRLVIPTPQSNGSAVHVAKKTTGTLS